MSKETGYQDLEEIQWTLETQRSGQSVRIRARSILVEIIELVATNGDVEWVITNNLAEDFTRSRAIEAIE